jgi:hypothetical protein
MARILLLTVLELGGAAKRGRAFPAAGARRGFAAGPLHVIKPHDQGSFLCWNELEEASAGIFVAP